MKKKINADKFLRLAKRIDGRIESMNWFCCAFLCPAKGRERELFWRLYQDFGGHFTFNGAHDWDYCAANKHRIWALLLAREIVLRGDAGQFIDV